MRRFASRLGWLSGLVLAGALTGCGHAPAVHGTTAPTPGAQTARLDMEPMTLEVSRGAAGTQIDAVDAPSLFEEGGRLLDSDRFADAARRYDRLVQLFPTSEYAAGALFNAALSYEGLGDHAEAASRYRRLVDGFPAARQSKEALLRLGACHAELGRWPSSVEVYEQAIARTDLNLSERVEAMSRRALGLFEAGNLTAAESGFRDAIAVQKANQEVERLESNYFLGMARFYVAHIAHKRFRDAPLRLVQLKQDLESKALEFSRAEALYVEAVKAQNPAWATASGYHIGTLYREMYDSVVSAPLPKELDQPPYADEKRLAYVGLVKESLRGLLEKARAIFEQNVVMGERIGVRNGWVQRSGEQLVEVEKLLAVHAPEARSSSGADPGREK